MDTVYEDLRCAGSTYKGPTKICFVSMTSLPTTARGHRAPKYKDRSFSHHPVQPCSLPFVSLLSTHPRPGHQNHLRITLGSIKQSFRRVLERNGSRNELGGLDHHFKATTRCTVSHSVSVLLLDPDHHFQLAGASPCFQCFPLLSPLMLCSDWPTPSVMVP